MTETSVRHHAPLPARREGAPGPVVAAVVITLCLGIVVLAAAGFVLFMLLIAGNTIIDGFGSSGAESKAWIDGLTVLALVWTVVAMIVAVLVLQGRAWARWTLCASSGGAVIASAAAAYAVVFPALVSVGALAVVILLVLPSSRVWSKEASPS